MAFFAPKKPNPFVAHRGPTTAQTNKIRSFWNFAHVCPEPVLANIRGFFVVPSNKNGVAQRGRCLRAPSSKASSASTAEKTCCGRYPSAADETCRKNFYVREK